jgi:DNA helicase-2/ATP-dependent DNA helicase PcrA
MFQLDETQKAVAGHKSGPLLVHAGAGTGKTSVQQFMVANLVQSGLAAPTDVLWITFTREAAGVCRDRLLMLLGQDLETKNISTVHSACLRLLNLRRRRRVKVADPEEAFDIFQRAMLQMGLTPDRWDAPVLYAQVCSKKENLVTAKDYKPLVGSFQEEALKRVYVRYQEILTEEGKLDFGDLVLTIVEELYADEDFLRYVRGLLPWVVVDEFQDTSVAQYEFIRLVTGSDDNLLCCGSPAQSIHEWRGAKYPHVRDGFRRDFPNAPEVTLPRNYRSSAMVVEAGKAIGWGYPDAQQEATRPPGDLIELWRPATQYEEAGRMAQFIARELDQGRQAQDIAVLLRTHRQAHIFESQFSASGIPYVVSGTSRLYKRQEVTHLLTYLELGSKPQDEASVESIINSPPRGLGPNSVLRLKGTHPILTLGVLTNAVNGGNGALPPRVEAAAAGLLGQLNAIGMQVAQGLPPADVIDFVLDVTGYREWAIELLDGYGRLRAMEQVQADAAGFDNLVDFLEHARKRTNEAAHVGVTISTIHGAKGREWPVVLVPGVVEGLLPHAKALKQSSEPEEERRLMYVAVTRAMDRLVLSAPVATVTEHRQVDTRPSRYLRLIPTDLLQEV